MLKKEKIFSLVFVFSSLFFKSKFKSEIISLCFNINSSTSDFGRLFMINFNTSLKLFFVFSSLKRKSNFIICSKKVLLKISLSFLFSNINLKISLFIFSKSFLSKKSGFNKEHNNLYLISLKK